jgi:DNA ligase 1
MQLLTSSIPSDVSDWWVSEKYDGIRAIWDGKNLLTRHGKRLNPPAWFTAGLPARRLDGELWMGRGTFARLQANLLTKGSDWTGIGFHIFDLAEAGTFEDRYAALQCLPLPGHAVCVSHELCTGMDDLDSRERDVVAAGGEGLVIRRPGCKYRPGRAGDVVKIKRLHADLERWQG